MKHTKVIIYDDATTSTSSREVPSRTVPPEVVAERREECLLCPHYQAGPDRCRLCGCSDTMERRTAMPWAKCPADKWAAVAPG